MSKLFQKYRYHRDAARRSRAIERAIREAPSRTVRDELLVMMQRFPS